jgi:hypothetical protein
MQRTARVDSRGKVVKKRTKSGGQVRRSSMSKHEKRSYKAYRGQGR